MGLRLLGANRAVVSPLIMFVAIVLAQRYGWR
jgi:hypothetical protein